MPGLRRRRTQRRRLAGPTPPPTFSAAARWPRRPVPGLRRRRTQRRRSAGPTPPPTPRRRLHLPRPVAGARSTTPTNTASPACGSDPTSHVQRSRPPPAGCQVYDADEHSVVGHRVRPHLPRPVAGARSTIPTNTASSACGSDPTSHAPSPVPGLRRRRTQRRRLADPTPPPTFSAAARRPRVPGLRSRRTQRRRLAAPTPPPTPRRRCQVYDPDKHGVVGLRVRPHLPRATRTNTPPGPDCAPGGHRLCAAALLRSVAPAAALPYAATGPRTRAGRGRRR